MGKGETSRTDGFSFPCLVRLGEGLEGMVARIKGLGCN